MLTKNKLILGFVSGISLLGYLYIGSLRGEIGFPLDDAWIHQTYARNIAEVGEWSFVQGQPSAGLTAPLWGVLLLPGHWLGWGPFLWTFVLGWLTLWGIGVVGMMGIEMLIPEKRIWGLWGGLVLVLEWHVVWAAVSGMETLLFSLIVLWVLIKLFRDNFSNVQALGLAGMIGLSVWVRPEGITLLGPVVLMILLTRDDWQKRWRGVGMVLFGFATVFLPYLLFNLSLAETVWPNTFFAKQAEYAALLENSLMSRLGQQFLLPLVGVGIVLLPGFIALIVRELKEKKWGVLLVSVWGVGHLILYALRLPVTYQHGRYAIPAMPVFFMLGMAGVGLIAQPRSPKMVVRILNQVWLLLIPVVLVMFWGLGAGAYAKDVAVINQEMVAVAKWVDENAGEHDLIAAHDIGALGYFAGRPLVDMAGLVSPEVIPFIRDEAALAEYLNEQKPIYFVTFPRWYPELVLQAELVYQTDGEASVEQGGENMTVYLWSK